MSILIIIFFAECSHDKSKNDTEDINMLVLKLKNKFPSLLNYSVIQKDTFNLARSVKNGINGFEVHLYSTNRRESIVQEILVISNKFSLHMLTLFSI